MMNLKSASVSIDWLNLTARWSDDDSAPSPLERFKTWASDHWGAPEPCSGARDFYRGGFRWPTGARVLFAPVDGSSRCSVSLPGACLAEFTLEEQGEICVELLAYGFKRCSRIDVAADLRGNRLDLVERFASAAERRQVRTIRYASKVRTDQKPPDSWRVHRGESNSGVCLGSRQSPRYVRIYDKGLETGLAPRASWIRMEGEYGNSSRTEWAQAVFSRVIQSVAGVRSCSMVEGSPGEEWPESIALPELLRRLVASLVEVSTAAGRTATKRAFVRPRWFADLVAGIEGVKLHCTRRVYRSLERSAAWIKCGVMPFLRACAVAAGHDVATVLHVLGGSPAPTEPRRSAASVQYGLVYAPSG